MESNNNQNMREALGVVIDACDTVFKMAHDSDFVKVWAKSVRSVAIKAISKPPRNCDVGTEREQSKRFDSYCYAHRTYEYGCRTCPLLSSVCCEFAWGQLPYEEGETK